jgi:hypothetical protein
VHFDAHSDQTYFNHNPQKQLKPRLTSSNGGFQIVLGARELLLSFGMRESKAKPHHLRPRKCRQSAPVESKNNKAERDAHKKGRRGRASASSLSAKFLMPFFASAASARRRIGLISGSACAPQSAASILIVSLRGERASIAHSFLYGPDDQPDDLYGAQTDVNATFTECTTTNRIATPIFSPAALHTHSLTHTHT